MLEDASVVFACPQCGCPMAARVSRAIVGTGTFCPACQVYIEFADERAGLVAAERKLAQTLRTFSKTINIEFKL